MPRARNIKPAFFKNDLLSDQDPLGRLLFIGLWTICDYRGCLEWRPKRVKAEILPYDNCDIEALAINLDKSGFIRFYSDGDKMFAKVVNFTTHQNPHKNERQSGTDIPDYTEEMRQAIDLKGLAIIRDKSGLKPEQYASDPADSCFLIPDSPILNPERENSSADASPPPKENPKPKTKRGQRLPDDWSLTEEYREAARLIRPDLLPVIETIAGKFADHWHSKTGANATKLDWLATWRNWLRNEKQASGSNSGYQTAQEKRAARNAEIFDYEKATRF